MWEPAAQRKRNEATKYASTRFAPRAAARGDRPREFGLTRLVLRVRVLPGRPQQGTLAFAGRIYPCALGRAGISHRKREGDGATPAGTLPLVAVLYRPDHVRRPRTRLPLRALRPDEGWCDAVADRNYNRPVRLPYPASHEAMWRQDPLYDIVVVLDWNLTRRIKGRGSAIFLHVARPGFAPTEGCVALRRKDLTEILRRLGPGATLRVSR